MGRGHDRDAPQRSFGFKWDDIDFTKRRLGLNGGLVAVGYGVHQTRGKTRTSRRSIDLDTTTLDVLAGWQAFQRSTFAAVGLDPDVMSDFRARYHAVDDPAGHPGRAVSGAVGSEASIAASVVQRSRGHLRTTARGRL